MLLPQHQEQLENSGISEEIARQRGYRSMHDVDGFRELKNAGFSKNQFHNLPGLLIPLWDVHGNQHTAMHYRPDTPRLRKDGTSVKYEWPQGQPMVLDMHPAGQPFLNSLDTVIYFTEGEKKADSLLTAGAKCVICLCGVDSWKTNDIPNPDFQYIPLRGREVRVVYDSDIVMKKSVQGALTRFCTFLRSRGAIVYVVYLPSQEGEKVGVDDFLVAGHSLTDLDSLCRAWPSEGQRLQARPSSFAPLATPYSDVLNAEYFAKYFGEDLRYCAVLGGWHRWTTTHWALCKEDLHGAAYEAARQTMRRLGVEAAKKEDAALLRHVSRSFSHGRLTSMLEQAATMAPFVLASTEVNNHPWLLNCRNGTVDLKTGALHAHNREDYLTQCLDIDYDPEATCDGWERFLWRLFGEDTQETGTDTLAFLQRAVGYSLTGSTREECLFLLWGSGRNGKSVFVNTIREMLGTYGTSTQMDTFLHRSQETIRNDLAALNGVRLVSAVEVQDGSRFNEGLIKQLTGNDPISARFLHHEYFSFIPTFKLWLAFNHKPEIRGTDTAVWERVQLIPFTAYIAPEERDKDLAAKLKAERAGILAWAVQGCLAWQREGLHPPKAVVAATHAYKTEQDILEQFFEEVCTRGKEYTVKMSKLYDAYRVWSNNGHEHLLTKTKMTRRLREDGRLTVSERGSYNDYTITGIGLSQTPDMAGYEEKEKNAVPF